MTEVIHHVPQVLEARHIFSYVEMGSFMIDVYEIGHHAIMTVVTLIV